MAFVVHFSPFDGHRVSSPNPKKNPAFSSDSLEESQLSATASLRQSIHRWLILVPFLFASCLEYFKHQSTEATCGQLTVLVQNLQW